MAAAAAAAAVACCLCAILLSCSVSTVSGAWPWEVGLLKNKTTTTEAPTSHTPGLTTVTPRTTTTTTPSAESTPRLRSRSRSHSKKHHFNAASTAQPATKDNTINTTTTTETPPLSDPPAAVETGPQFLAPVQPQLPAAPPPEMSPIVIVEPESYADAGRTYRSMYEPPYGVMYPPPMPYSPPLPYYSPPPPQSMPPYPPSMYDTYSFGGYPSYPSYQWPAVEPPYLRQYRSYPYGPFPSLGRNPPDNSPYPWWAPQVLGMPLGAAAPAAKTECSSEQNRDREEFKPASTGLPVDQKANDPAPTYVSLLPGTAGKVPSLDNPKSSMGKESNVRVEDIAAQPNTSPGNNAYGMGQTVGRKNHILRNNPYQPAPQNAFWPGYYDQSQWPQWNQWQQWPGVQQPQYTYGVQSQQSAVEPSQKRQVPAYGQGGQQYA